MEETITPKESVTEETDVKTDVPAEGDGAASENQTPLSLDTLNKELGREFPDDATALKAVKDTFSHVGDVKNLNTLKEAMTELKGTLKLGSDNEVLTYMKDLNTGGGEQKDVNMGDYVKKEVFDDATFYSENPDLKPHSRLIDSFRKQPENVGKTLPNLIESDEGLKKTLDSLQAQTKAEESKSVLQSSPRLGQVKDKIDSAREAAKTGNMEQAAVDATQAVIENAGL